MNYGKIIKLKFDGRVYNISSKEKSRFRLIDAYGKYTYPVDVTVGASNEEVYLHFDDINGLIFPAYLECLQTIAMGSENVSFSAFTTEMFLDNLWPIPGAAEYFEISSIDAIGEYALAFDGKAYFDEYLQISSVAVVGNCVALTFSSRYFSEYYQITSVAASGQYCDINGNPL